MVRSTPRNTTQWTARTPRASRRSVHRAPEPIEHFAERIRTTCPGRPGPRTRRTKSPETTPNTCDGDRLLATIGTTARIQGKRRNGQRSRASGPAAASQTPHQTISQAPDTYRPEIVNSIHYVACASYDVKTQPGGHADSRPNRQERLYIFSGFDDYRIATSAHRSCTRASALVVSIRYLLMQNYARSSTPDPPEGKVLRAVNVEHQGGAQ